MTPAEFKTLREGMGLAAEEVAALLGVTRKTVFAMESPTRALDVPEEHAAGLRAIADRFHAAVQATAATGDVLVRYTDEAKFQKRYGLGKVPGRRRKDQHLAEVAPLPLSMQGPLLFAVTALWASPIEYGE
ncbi:hypothetical protein SEA_DELAGARZA_46 [Microbacterium phage DelaGarza]|nr:hypothetical protein SEA_DELAGARZA_46 [Microbacterium phage DelaGarza]